MGSRGSSAGRLAQQLANNKKLMKTSLYTILLFLSINTIIFTDTKSQETDSSFFTVINVFNLSEGDSLYEFKKILLNVPEIREFYNNLTNNSLKPFAWIKHEPDSTSDYLLYRNYYFIYVGRDIGIMLRNWDWFLIDRDRKNIYWYDLPDDTLRSLDYWRNSKKH